MAIPRYEREKINAQTATEQYGGLQGDAEARGQARIAGEAKNLAGQQGQRANIEVNSFSQRLNMFSQQLDTGMKMHAMDKAVNDASTKLDQQNQKIKEIKYDESLSMEEKSKQINELGTKLKDDIYSVYGNMYNDTVKSDYVNQATISSAEMALQLKEQNEDSPEKFKDMFREYSSEAVKGAPDMATKLASQRLYDKMGLATYKTMYNEKQTKQDREARDTARFALVEQERRYVNNVAINGETGGENLAGYDSNVDNQVDRGWISNATGLEMKKSIRLKGEQGRAMTIFSASMEEGQGADFYNQMKKAYEEKQFTHWEPGKAESMMRTMSSALTDKAEYQAEYAVKMYNDGEIPDAKVVTQLDSYKEFLNPSDQRKLEMAKRVQPYMLQGKGLTLPESIEILQQDLKAEKNPVEREVIKRALNITEAQQREMDSDPITGGNSQGEIETKMLSPGTISPEAVAKRKEQSSKMHRLNGGEKVFFSKSELKTFSSYINNPGTSVADKTKLIATIDDADAFVQLGKDAAPIFSAAATQYKTGKRDVAEGILRGEQFLKDNGVLGSIKTLRSEVLADMGNYFKYGGAGDIDKVTSSIVSLAAKYAVEDGNDIEAQPDGWFQNKYRERATEEIMGKSDKYRGHTFFAPPGKEPDEIKEALGELKNAEPILGVNPGEEISVLQQSELIYIPTEDVYEFRHKNDSSQKKGKSLRNPDGTVYKMRLR